MNFRVLSLLFCTFATLRAQDALNDPEDIDDVKPPVAEVKVEPTTKKIEAPPAIQVQPPLDMAAQQKIQLQPVAVNEIPLLTSNVTEPGNKEEAAPKEVEEKQDTDAIGTTLPAGAPAQEFVRDDKPNEEVVFERNDEQVEGGKGEEDPDADVDKVGNIEPPKDEADGAAKEDRETAAGQAGSLHEAVEEAKGNPVQETVPKKPLTADDEQTLETRKVARPERVENKFYRHEGLADEEEQAGFMSFFFFFAFVVVAAYLVHHNKKKILGVIFEGAPSSGRRGNVRYRRLSQGELA